MWIQKELKGFHDLGHGHTVPKWKKQDLNPTPLPSGQYNWRESKSQDWSEML